MLVKSPHTGNSFHVSHRREELLVHTEVPASVEARGEPHLPHLLLVPIGGPSQQVLPCTQASAAREQTAHSPPVKLHTG